MSTPRFRLLFLVLFGHVAVPSRSLAQSHVPDLSQVSIEDLMSIEISSASRKEQRVALRVRCGWPGVASIALATTTILLPCASPVRGQSVTAPAIKAAFLYNFAKFATWPALPSGAPINVCVVGDDGLAAAFVETVRGQNISGHALDVWRPQDSATWPMCHVLFIADTETRRLGDGLDGLKTLPVLTVSDGKGFSRAGGIIELYVEGGRMRFAINVDAAKRSGVQVSSRLLGLAKVIRDGHVQ